MLFVFFFFFFGGNYNHGCIQLLVTKEHEEKRWAWIALGKILEEGDTVKMKRIT